MQDLANSEFGIQNLRMTDSATLKPKNAKQTTITPVPRGGTTRTTTTITTNRTEILRYTQNDGSSNPDNLTPTFGRQARSRQQLHQSAVAEPL